MQKQEDRGEKERSSDHKRVSPAGSNLPAKQKHGDIECRACGGVTKADRCFHRRISFRYDETVRSMFRMAAVKCEVK